MATVSFTRMDEMKPEDRTIIEPEFAAYRRKTQNGLADCILRMLAEQNGSSLGYAIDRLQHSLQTASRAVRDGVDDEMIAVALLHDIGDGLAMFNHSEFAAALLRPFVSERNAWIVQHHGLFQGYHYFHYLGRDRNEREKLRGHPHFDACLDFCERWDQVSFDPAYDTIPLEYFVPIVHRLFEKEPRGFD